MYKAEGLGKEPSLTRAIVNTFGKGYVSLGLFALVTVSYLNTSASTW